MTPQQNDAPAYTYTRDDKRRRVRVDRCGDFALGDAVAVLDQQVREGTWQYALLYDVRRMTTGPTRDDSVALIEYVRRIVETHGPRGPVAVVARRGEVVGPIQAYAFRAADLGLQVEVFWDLSHAEQWLDKMRKAAATPGDPIS